MEEVLIDTNEIVEVNEDNSSNSQSRRYMLTINNPDMTDEEMFVYIESLEHIKYACFQREKGHETGTIHFQIFLIFTIGKRFSTIKNLFERAHIDPAKGSNVQCRDYCSKSDTRVSGPYEIGRFAEEKSRTDITNLFELVRCNVPNSDIMKLYPSQYLRYIDKIERIRQDMLYENLSNKIKDNLIVVYIYGSSGVGKTYNLFKHYGNKACFISNYSKNPFDAYKNQDVIVFDEFRGQLDFSEFLKLIDIYPVQLSRRYNDMYGNYTKVFILTNQNPNTQYSYIKHNNNESWRGFFRRLHFVLNFRKDKIIIEKAEKSVEELKKIIPQSMADLLEVSKYCNAEEVVKKFDVIQSDFLPFSDDVLF